jgi:hypothetical protein
MSEQQTTEALAACECGHPVIDHYGGCDFCSCRFTHEMALNAHVERIVAARLAVVEALCDEAENPPLHSMIPLGCVRASEVRAALRAVVAADPAEWSCRDCGATGSLSDSVTHRCVVAVVAADPADTTR